ncbi:MAG TPA: phosphoesterase [Nanoarchaeota archaeon]|nr:phosphoesterase [Nanoarchaeota archaeon]
MLILSHGDADGVCSVAVFYKAKQNSKIPVIFTSPAALKDTLCRSMIKRALDELYIFDLAGTRETVRIASAWKKVVWIDHHSWEPEDKFENMEIIIKPYPSATQVVAEYFGIKDGIIEIANEIDTNSIKSSEAEFLRNLIGAIKWKFNGKKELNSKLREISKEIAFKGIEEMQTNENYAKLIQEFNEFIENSLNEVVQKIKIESINGMKIAIYESTKFLPVYAITEKLSEHEEAPFDIIAVICYRVSEKGVSTKIELRTQTGVNVKKIAEMLNGGGHKVAAGATVQELYTGTKIIELIKNLQEEYSIT